MGIVVLVVVVVLVLLLPVVVVVDEIMVVVDDLIILVTNDCCYCYCYCCCHQSEAPYWTEREKLPRDRLELDDVWGTSGSKLSFTSGALTGSTGFVAVLECRQRALGLASCIL